MSGTYPKGNSRSDDWSREGLGAVGGAGARRRRQAHQHGVSLGKGVAGLVLCACIASFCLAGESNDSGRTSTAKERNRSQYTGGSRFSGGLIDPMNPNGYMESIANRLNTTGGANTLLNSARPSGAGATTRQSSSQGFTELRSNGPVRRNLGTFRSLGGGEAPAPAAPANSPLRPATTNLSRFRALGGSTSTRTSRETEARAPAPPETNRYASAAGQPAAPTASRREPLPTVA
ncbi:MAG: hypothetical protein JW741_13695, partial [Sedimentisphaerales bacterium]|nr:hypothetical protein [Sedimentisphaerales bacterium]